MISEFPGLSFLYIATKWHNMLPGIEGLKGHLIGTHMHCCSKRNSACCPRYTRAEKVMYAMKVYTSAVNWTLEALAVYSTLLYDTLLICWALRSTLDILVYVFASILVYLMNAFLCSKCTLLSFTIRVYMFWLFTSVGINILYRVWVYNRAFDELLYTACVYTTI